MEDKKITEQESLELISQMIQQTKKETAIGSGNMFLMWGYLCTFMSLAVFAMSQIRQESGWGWLYMAIPVAGFITAGIMARWMKRKYNAPSTYTSSSISKMWLCLSFVFVFYAIRCFMHWEEPQGWTGMFLLGLLLPGIGTYCTGAILKENWVQWCGVMGTTFGCAFIHDICCDGIHISPKWCILMALAMVITLVIPGHILNYKAKKANSNKKGNA